MVRKGFFIDPSGLGTTGGCLVNLDNDEVIQFYEYKSAEWLKHLSKLIDFCKKETPMVIVYETTTYISEKNRGHHMTSLFKLFGGIESLRYIIPSVKNIDSETVNVIKNFRDRVLNRGLRIKDLEYKRGSGKGWTYKGEKLSSHKLDAYLIYWWWKKPEDEKEQIRKEWKKESSRQSYHRNKNKVKVVKK